MTPSSEAKGRTKSSLNSLITTQAYSYVSSHFSIPTEDLKPQIPQLRSQRVQIDTHFLGPHVFRHAYIYIHSSLAGDSIRTRSSPLSFKHSQKLKSHPTPCCPSHFNLLLPSVFAVLEYECRVSHMLGKHFIPQLHLQPFANTASCDLVLGSRMSTLPHPHLSCRALIFSLKVALTHTPLSP